MLSDDELRELLRAPESDRVERTASAADKKSSAKRSAHSATTCPDRRAVGVLFVGVHDDGRCANLEIDEQLIQTLLGFRRDGTISPFPSLTVERREIDGCMLAVVEVRPSDNPPLRFNGRTCVRVRPRKGYATPEDERRLTEKRRWGQLPFDQQPVSGSRFEDLDLLLFEREILPSVVARDVLAENGRELGQQLASLRLLHVTDVPTAAGLLTCGRDPLDHIPGAYVQFVRYGGREIGDTVRDSRTISGALTEQLRSLDELIDLNIENRADLSGARESLRPTYPRIAVQELLRNAVIHRTYEGTASPVRLTWFDDRVEITSPGGPYGSVTVHNFGEPGPTDYRNPTVADIARALGFVQKFGSGIARARNALDRNGNPPPVFRAEPSYVHVSIGVAR